MLDDLSTPLDLQDATLGPVTVEMTTDRIAFYATTTGDDPQRWSDEAPPGFASVLLFAVADLFLYHPKVVPFTATLLHLDQSFTYRAPMRAGSTATVAGTITRVRERAGSFFVTFQARASSDGVDVVESTSTFVLSDQAAPEPEVSRSEPPPHRRGRNGDGWRSASRHDLVRYAAATRDFNPLHWDHMTAFEAGLPGTVVHGLLMYAWMAQDVQSVSQGRISSAKVRFRNALLPGEEALISTDVDDASVKVTLARGDTQLVTGSATVAADRE
jgi:acyl dehydratase